MTHFIDSENKTSVDEKVRLFACPFEHAFRWQAVCGMRVAGRRRACACKKKGIGTSLGAFRSIVRAAQFSCISGG